MTFHLNSGTQDSAPRLSGSVSFSRTTVMTAKMLHTIYNLAVHIHS
jgi:hypothetical protein